MKVAKIAGLLLVFCFLAVGLQAMEKTYIAEERLLNGSFSVDTYFSSLKGRLFDAVNELRTADYSQSPDGNYYEQLVNAINNMVDAMSRNQVGDDFLKSLNLKIRRFILFYYNELKDAKERGTVRIGRAT